MAKRSPTFVKKCEAARLEIATLLKTNVGNVDGRMIGLKIAPTCGRCGGSGRYSFNQMDGDRCFGCGGFGHVKPKIGDYPNLVEVARAAANDGRLDHYLAGLAARKNVKQCTDKFFARWKQIEVKNPYDWRKAADYATGRDRSEYALQQRQRADINAIAAAACDKLQKANAYEFKRQKTPQDHLDYSAAFEAAMYALDVYEAEVDKYNSMVRA